MSRCLPAIIIGLTISRQVRRNAKNILNAGSSSEGAWTFGQLLSLVEIISTLNEIIKFIIKLCSSDRGQAKDHPTRKETAVNGT